MPYWSCCWKQKGWPDNDALLLRAPMWIAVIICLQGSGCIEMRDYLTTEESCHERLGSWYHPNGLEPGRDYLSICVKAPRFIPSLPEWSQEAQ